MNTNWTVYVAVRVYNVFLYAFVRARKDAVACDYFPSCVIISYLLLIAKLGF